MDNIELNNEQLAMILSTVVHYSRMKCIESNCESCKLKPINATRCSNDLGDYEFVLDLLEWLNLNNIKLYNYKEKIKNV